MTSGRRAPRESAARQAISAVVIVAVIGVTLFGGLLITLAETSGNQQELPGPTSTIFRISTVGSTADVASPTAPAATLPNAPAPLTVGPTLRPTQVVTVVSSPIVVNPSSCTPPVNWVKYVVQPGDTLFTIGIRYGLLVDSLMSANCLTSESIKTGQSLLVPPITPMAVSSSNTAIPGGASSAGATATHTSTDGACTANNSIIKSPAVGAVLRGKVSIIGTANVPNFSYYKLEIREDGGPQMFVTFVTATTPVVNGVLTELNTQAFRNGAWWLRVVVVDTFNTYPEPCSIMVYFDN